MSSDTLPEEKLLILLRIKNCQRPGSWSIKKIAAFMLESYTGLAIAQAQHLFERVRVYLQKHEDIKSPEAFPNIFRAKYSTEITEYKPTQSSTDADKTLVLLCCHLLLADEPFKQADSKLDYDGIREYVSKTFTKEFISGLDTKINNIVSQINSYKNQSISPSFQNISIEPTSNLSLDAENLSNIITRSSSSNKSGSLQVNYASEKKGFSDFVPYSKTTEPFFAVGNVATSTSGVTLKVTKDTGANGVWRSSMINNKTPYGYGYYEYVMDTFPGNGVNTLVSLLSEANTTQKRYEVRVVDVQGLYTNNHSCTEWSNDLSTSTQHFKKRLTNDKPFSSTGSPSFRHGLLYTRDKLEWFINGVLISSTSHSIPPETRFLIRAGSYVDSDAGRNVGTNHDSFANIRNVTYAELTSTSATAVTPFTTLQISYETLIPSEKKSLVPGSSTRNGLISDSASDIAEIREGIKTFSSRIQNNMEAFAKELDANLASLNSNIIPVLAATVTSTTSISTSQDFKEGTTTLTADSTKATTEANTAKTEGDKISLTKITELTNTFKTNVTKFKESVTKALHIESKVNEETAYTDFGAVQLASENISKELVSLRALYKAYFTSLSKGYDSSKNKYKNTAQELLDTVSKYVLNISSLSNLINTQGIQTLETVNMLEKVTYSIFMADDKNTSALEALEVSKDNSVRVFVARIRRISQEITALNSNIYSNRAPFSARLLNITLPPVVIDAAIVDTRKQEEPEKEDSVTVAEAETPWYNTMTFYISLGVGIAVILLIILFFILRK